MKEKRMGRTPKENKIAYRYSVNFTSIENAHFLAMYEQTDIQSKATFIKARVFNESFRVIKIDRTLLDYYQKLSSLYGQFRAIGVN
ncbi:MAG: conjugal transfer protein MobA, partial [Bacteroidales bacterium]